MEVQGATLTSEYPNNAFILSTSLQNDLTETLTSWKEASRNLALTFCLVTSNELPLHLLNLQGLILNPGDPQG